MPGILFLLPLLIIFACGGGGGGGGTPAANTDPGTSTGTGTGTGTVTITGTISAAVSKPSSGKSTQLYGVSSWAGAALQVVDASGTVVGTGTVNADGSYSVSVPKGSNYFIRAQSGNLVLKAFVPSVTANASVSVNTTTTAEVVVLASVLGVANVGDPAVNAATAIASVNITTVVTQITANTGIPTLATSLATEIASSYNASATTATIGSASTSVTTTVTTIAASIPQSVAVVAVPSAPSGVGVTVGNGQVSITWTAVTGATSYNVYYRTSTGVTTGNGTKVTGATSGGAITSLTNGTTYYFVVTAVNAGGESAVSNEVNAMPQVPAPGAPTGVGVTAGNGQATVSWTAVTGATSYNVYYKTTTGVTIANGTKVTGAMSGGAITGLTNGTTYYFVVTAVNAGGESVVSSEVNATPQVPAPGAPTGVGVTAGDAQATVSWTTVTGATSYNVYYRTTAGVTTGNGTKVTGATSGGAITGLTNGLTYYFVVTAVDAGGESAVSSEVGATPQVPAPGAPTGVGVTAGNAQVTISWTTVTGATSYNVYYRATTGVTTGNGTKVTGATSGGAITGLTNGTTYYFVVTAVNAGGESIVSSEASATLIPSAPTGIGIIAGTAQATINWTASTGATSYNVYYRTTAGVTIGNGTKVTGAISGSAITGLTNNTTYYFVVTAVNTAGESVASSEANAIPVPAPAAPTGVTITGGNWQATVSWTAVAGATSYNVYYRTTAGVTTGNGTKVAGATSGGVITVLTNGTTYYFVVTAVNAGGESAVSSEFGVVPFVPTLLGGTIQGGAALIGKSTNGVVTTLAGSALVVGSTDATGTAARFYNPWGITTDGTNLYVTDSINNTIRKFALTTGVVTTLAGSAGIAGLTDGAGTAARFYRPQGITTDGTNLYVADAANFAIRKVVITSGVVTTLAGSVGGVGSTDGTGAVAQFSNLDGVATDGTNLYVMDYGNSTIRKIQ